MSSVFISHAAEDKELAEDLYHALERQGYTAYLDKKVLTVGKEFNAEIEKYVNKSDYFVFLISPESIQEGTYALTELRYAETKWGKQSEGIIPVMVRPVEAKALPAFLRQLTFFSTAGNVTAEVVSEINKRTRAGIEEIDHGKAERAARATAYFQEELDDREKWYSFKAAYNAKIYRYTQTVSILLAGLVPLIVLLRLSPNLEIQVKLITALLGITIVLVLAFSFIGNHQVKSLRYRFAAERMKRERRKYVNFTAPYTAGLGENRAYELFVETIEQIMQDEERI